MQVTGNDSFRILSLPLFCAANFGNRAFLGLPFKASEQIALTFIILLHVAALDELTINHVAVAAET